MTPRLAIIGAGYVGLVTGCCFSHMGYQVTLVENSLGKLELLQQGHCPIYEVGLSELLEEGLSTSRVVFLPSIKKLLAEQTVDFIFLAVGTPSLFDGMTDTSYLLDAVQELLEHIKSAVTLVIKSTVPVGTASQIKKLIREKNLKYPVEVVSNPEFLREGRAVQDFLRPDRVVIGSESVTVSEQVAGLYRTLERQGHKTILTSNEEAEMAKYACNVMLASRITTMNQIARLCEKLKINVHKIREVVGSDSRIGSEYLYPGLGYGGSCLPKDVSSFILQCEAQSADASFVMAIHQFNEKQKCYFLNLIREEFPNAENIKIGVLGLAFKADTDDVRESVAVTLIPNLVAEGYRVKVHDPKAVGNFSIVMGSREQGKITYCESALAAIQDVDALLVLTEWQEYRRLTPEFFAQHMRGKVIFDGRNMFERKLFMQHGFKIKGIGWDT